VRQWQDAGGSLTLGLETVFGPCGRVDSSLSSRHQKLVWAQKKRGNFLPPRGTLAASSELARRHLARERERERERESRRESLVWHLSQPLGRSSAKNMVAWGRAYLPKWEAQMGASELPATVCKWHFLNHWSFHGQTGLRAGLLGRSRVAQTA